MNNRSPIAAVMLAAASGLFGGMPTVAVPKSRGVPTPADAIDEAIEEIGLNTRTAPPPPPARASGTLTDAQIRARREHDERCRKGQRAKFRKGK